MRFVRLGGSYICIEIILGRKCSQDLTLYIIFNKLSRTFGASNILHFDQPTVFLFLFLELRQVVGKVGAENKCVMLLVMVFCLLYLLHLRLSYVYNLQLLLLLLL